MSAAVHSTDVATAAADESQTDSYARHPLLLRFRDSATEARYCNFQFIDNAFIPGKIFGVTWLLFLVGAFFVFSGLVEAAVEGHDDPFVRVVDALTNPWWIGNYVATGVTAPLTVALLFEDFKPFRETAYLIMVGVGLPAYHINFHVAKVPDVYNYGGTFGVSFFSVMMVQSRFCRLWPLVTVYNMVAFLVITFSVPSYWATRTYVEMLYWPMQLFPVALLFFMEKRTRQSFVEKEQGQEEISAIEHAALATQRMIANFFPATPTRELLLSSNVNGARHCAFPNTVLIVTDIAGFTAYTSRSQPSDVIAMLTALFKSIDLAAPSFGVEKVSTVGDSYCGAIFATGSTAADKSERPKPAPAVEGTVFGQEIASRCVAAVSFSATILHFAEDLTMRVGVHVGDVVGGFVGCSPPKFDLFGKGIDHARKIEEGGTPAMVHVSAAVVACVGDSWGAPREPEETPLGIICRGWAYADDEDHVDVDSLYAAGIPPGDPDHTNDEVDNPANRAAGIVKALVAFSKNEEAVSSVSNGSIVHSEADEEYDAESGSETAGTTTFDFHFIFMTFNSASVERRFMTHVRESGINLFCAQLFLMMELCLFVAHVLLSCRTSRDMTTLAVISAIIAAFFAYLSFVGTKKHSFHAVVTWIAYNAVVVVTFTGVTVDCGGLERRAAYIGDVSLCYFFCGLFASNYCLDNRISLRFAALLVAGGLVFGLQVYRKVVWQDDMVAYELTFQCGFVFFCLSLFIDHSLRSAFKTHCILQRLKLDARGRAAALSASAMRIMLPAFVTERIVEMTRHDAAENSVGSDMGSDSSGSTKNRVAVDFNTISATWEYAHVVVLFATFDSDGMRYDEVDRAIQSMELIVQRYNVLKVKTIGSTIMCVAGADGTHTRQSDIGAVVSAARDMRREVLRPLAAKSGESAMRFSVGVSIGPCFGAVIGGNGAIFDIFGDTINIASRMMSTAPRGAIQLSAAAHAMMPPTMRDATEQLPDVKAKGKGVMEVYGITD
jgi:class 3 adenylate cyclase